MALGKGAAALNQNGLIYTDSNIDQLLFGTAFGSEIPSYRETDGRREKEDIIR